MSTLKLTYFNSTGRAELTRLLLTYGNKEFEDIRITREEFLNIKPTLPLGQLPIFEVDGHVISQSHAIERYVAKLVGLYPQDPLQAAKAEMVVEADEDIIRAIIPILFGNLAQNKDVSTICLKTIQTTTKRRN